MPPEHPYDRNRDPRQEWRDLWILLLSVALTVAAGMLLALWIP